MAIQGPEQGEVTKWAEKLIARLEKSKELTDVWVNRESFPQPGCSLEIDREKLKAQGLQVDDVQTTLQVYLGALDVNNFNRFGRTWQVVVQTDAKSVKQLKQLKIRNAQGNMVSLETVVAIREFQAPRVIHRLNLRPMVAITANSAEGTSLAEARAQLEKLAEDTRVTIGLSTEYRLSRLSSPTRK